MDTLLQTTFHGILDDLSLLSQVLSIYLTYKPSSSLIDGGGGKAGKGEGYEVKTMVPRSKMFEVLRMVMDGEWEEWLETHGGPQLLSQLRSSPLGPNTSPSSIAPTPLIDFLRVFSLSVISDIAVLPFWGLKVNHIAGVFRSEELKNLVSDNVKGGYLRGRGLWGQVAGMLDLSYSSVRSDPLGAVRRVLRGATGMCLLGAFRNYERIKAREDEGLETTNNGGGTGGGKDTTPGSSYQNRIGDNGNSMGVLHGGLNQKFTGRPRPKGSRDKWSEDRASGNVFYSSEENLLNMKRKEFDDYDSKKGEVTAFGRAVISVLLHPLELISVRQVTSGSPEYSTFLKSARSIYRETPGGSYMGFFAGWRSTMINAVVLPTGGWWLMGLPYLIRIRRMMPDVKVVGSGGFRNVVGVDSFGKSLEIIRLILTEGGGGIPALLSGFELTIRTLVPSFLALASARLLVHTVFGRSTAARIKRVRRNAFIRAFFESNRIEAKF